LSRFLSQLDDFLGGYFENGLCPSLYQKCQLEGVSSSNMCVIKSKSIISNYHLDKNDQRCRNEKKVGISHANRRAKFTVFFKLIKRKLKVIENTQTYF
jgi:hypothetical protein